jgi:hypothetical protein
MFFSVEGFETISNIRYNFKEVFLVAPTEASQNGNAVSPYTITSDNDYRSQGYTKEKAQAICRRYGGDLATLAQLKMAYDNSGNWCPAGWILDSNDNIYNLPTKTNTCGVTSIGRNPSLKPAVTDSGIKKGFAICYAPKPAFPSVLVQSFNSTEYSMVSATVLSKIMNGASNDIFPIEFTISQAYYGVDNAPNRINTITGEYDPNAIRSWLINNYASLDTRILNSQNYSDDPAGWDTLQKINNKSCILIKEKDDSISDKLLQIKQGFQDISGYVLASIQSKYENANIQALLYSICSQTDPVSSPACAKLATLDFDKYYTNTNYNTLADLQTLNTQIYMRREEICQILYNIRKIKLVLGCNYNPRIPACSRGCIVIPATATTVETLDCSGTDIFDINNVGGLTLSLEEISPLFDVSAYKSILTNVVTNLSYIVETPTLVNIPNPATNLALINTAVRNIQDMISAIR